MGCDFGEWRPNPNHHNDDREIPVLMGDTGQVRVHYDGVWDGVVVRGT